MNSNSADPTIPYRRSVRACGAFAAAVGLLALAGWCLGLPRLASMGRDAIPMAPSTAILCLLQGIAVWLRAGPASSAHGAGPIGRRQAAAPWLIAALHITAMPVAITLLYLSSRGIYLQVERLGLSTSLRLGTVPIGHMSSLTALCFLLAVISFLASIRHQHRLTWRNATALVLAAILTVGSAILLLAYLYGNPLFYTGSIVPPAMPTAAAFLALGLAAMALAVPGTWREQLQVESATQYSFTFALLFTLLAVSIITLGYLETSRLEARYRSEVETWLAAIADLKVSEIAQWRKDRLGGASVIFKNEAFTGLVRNCLAHPESGEPRETLRAWIGQIQRAYDYDRVSLLDASGLERLSAPDEAQPLSPAVAERARDAWPRAPLRSSTSIAPVRMTAPIWPFWCRCSTGKTHGVPSAPLSCGSTLVSSFIL